MVEFVAERLRALPDQPGIYIFRGEDGGALYVGKAKSLRKRAVHYLGSGHEARIAAMLAAARELECVLTDTESEALLLENHWIKRERPPYNVVLRDDKTYPYVALTAETYPRIVFTRRIRTDGSETFGPFLPGGRARQAIKLAQKLFGIRVCDLDLAPEGTLPRPCLYYDLRRCQGPCVAGLTTPEAYAEGVAQTRLLLAGRGEELARRLRTAMQDASERQDYEEAARLRDLVSEVLAVSQRRKLSSTGGEDVDIFGVRVQGSRAALVALIMRDGKVLDRRELFWERPAGEALTVEGLLSELLPQFYDRTDLVPKEIHLPAPIDGEEALLAWLEERKGERVYLRLPSRGPKAQRLALAARNAELAFARRFRLQGEADAGPQALMDALGLAERPRRIEGFDISQLQGSEMVASLVVWEDGKLRKGEYRSFNIRGLPGQDDFAALRQAVGRRYRRRLEETGMMPDLVLIDGGRGQLNAALAALAELGVEETPLVGLAKREEELYVVDRPEPLRLQRTDPGLQLLQRLRDEAHRFALGRHRARRSRSRLGSRLDELPGIGPRRRRLLLRHFGSLAGVREASLEALQGQLGPKLGAQVHRGLHPEENGGGEGVAAAGPDPGVE